MFIVRYCKIRFESRKKKFAKKCCFLLKCLNSNQTGKNQTDETPRVRVPEEQSAWPRAAGLPCLREGIRMPCCRVF